MSGVDVDDRIGGQAHSGVKLPRSAQRLTPISGDAGCYERSRNDQHDGHNEDDKPQRRHLEIHVKTLADSAPNAMVKLLDRLDRLRLADVANPLGKGVQPAGIATPLIIPPARVARGWQKRAGRYIGRAIPVAFALMATACAHKPVDPPAALPVAVSCVPTGTLAAPSVHTPEQLRLAPDDASFVVMTAADYEKLYAWMIQASPALEGCRKAADPPT